MRMARTVFFYEEEYIGRGEAQSRAQHRVSGNGNSNQQKQKQVSNNQRKQKQVAHKQQPKVSNNRKAADYDAGFCDAPMIDWDALREESRAANSVNADGTINAVYEHRQPSLIRRVTRLIGFGD